MAAAGAAIVSIMVFGAAVFWLWVFGDDVWPSRVESALVIVAFAAGVATFGVTFRIVSKRR